MHLCLSRVRDSTWTRGTQQSHPLPAAVEERCSFCALSFCAISKAWIASHLPAALAQGRESTFYGFHGDILQKDRGSRHSPHLQLPVGGISQSPPLTVSGSQHHTEPCLFPAASPKGLSPSWPALHCPSFTGGAGYKQCWDQRHKTPNLLVPSVLESSGHLAGWHFL